ncbi:MAG TPA: hypothetical protein VFA04_16930 [Bryobacteraceae bacterium]|nr:hypothetical protein [Bryobacteraceae bacterium]
MDERERERYQEARERTAYDRMDFIDAELGTGAAFAGVAESHYCSGQNREARRARAQAAKALYKADDAMQMARDNGQATMHFTQRADRLRMRVEDLYVRDLRPDEPSEAA